MFEIFKLNKKKKELEGQISKLESIITEQNRIGCKYRFISH